MRAPQRHAPEILFLAVEDFVAGFPAHEVVTAQQVRIRHVDEMVERYPDGLEAPAFSIQQLDREAFEPVVAQRYVAAPGHERAAFVLAMQEPFEDGFRAARG